MKNQTNNKPFTVEVEWKEDEMSETEMRQMVEPQAPVTVVVALMCMVVFGALLLGMALGYVERALK